MGVCVCAFIALCTLTNIKKKLSHYMAPSLNCDYSDSINTCQ